MLAEHVGRQLAAGDGVEDLDWDVALSAYNAVRPERCRRGITTGRAWGELWHVDGVKRLQRNAILRARDTYDYTFTEWIYGNTALLPEDESPMYPTARWTRSRSPTSRRRTHASSSRWSDRLGYWRLLNRTRPEGRVRMSQLSGWSAMWWWGGHSGRPSARSVRPPRCQGRR